MIWNELAVLQEVLPVELAFSQVYIAVTTGDPRHFAAHFNLGSWMHFKGRPTKARVSDSERQRQRHSVRQ